MTIARIDVRRSGGGILLALSARDGRVGLGEASPLAGYSPDSLVSCHAALCALSPSALHELEADGPALARELELSSSAIDAALPAARHALETALLDLASQRRQEPLWALLARALGPRAVPSLVPLAALIDGKDVAELVARAEASVAAGFRTLKLKLGRRPFSLDYARLRAVREAIGPAVELRLDVNQRWDTTQAFAYLEELAPLRPELVEECVPLSALSELGRSPVPLALDESLQRDPPLDALDTRDLAALVLKPMALGGMSRCLALARFAAERELDLIVSHVFDGPVALAAAAHLALAIGSPYRAAGLAPHAGLSEWPPVALRLVQATHVIADDQPGIGLAHTELAA